MLGQLSLQATLQHGLDQLGQEPARPGQPQPVTLDLLQHLVHRLRVDEIRDRLTRRLPRRGLVQDRLRERQPRPAGHPLTQLRDLRVEIGRGLFH
jgi:hypothetical protein